jgi:hypothetical protein
VVTGWINAMILINHVPKRFLKLFLLSNKSTLVKK